MTPARASVGMVGRGATGGGPADAMLRPLAVVVRAMLLEASHARDRWAVPAARTGVRAAGVGTAAAGADRCTPRIGRVTGGTVDAPGPSGGTVEVTSPSMPRARGKGIAGAGAPAGSCRPPGPPPRARPVSPRH